MNIVSTYTHDAILTYVREVRKSVIGNLGKNEFEYLVNAHVTMWPAVLKKQAYTCSLVFMSSRHHLHHCFTNFRRDNDLHVILGHVSSEMVGCDLATEVANEILCSINARYKTINQLNNIDLNVFEGPECGVLCMHDNVSDENYLFLICQGRALHVSPGSIIVLSTSSNKHTLMSQIMEDNAECSYHTHPYAWVDERIKKIVKKFDY